MKESIKIERRPIDVIDDDAQPFFFSFRPRPLPLPLPLPLHQNSPPTGASFEHKILANERNNAKFGFLLPDDPYHAYYRAKVEAFSEEKKAEGGGEGGSKEARSSSSGSGGCFRGQGTPPPPPRPWPSPRPPRSCAPRSRQQRRRPARKEDGKAAAAATLSAPEPDLFSVRIPAGSDFVGRRHDPPRRGLHGPLRPGLRQGPGQARGRRPDQLRLPPPAALAARLLRGARGSLSKNSGPT